MYRNKDDLETGPLLPLSSSASSHASPPASGAGTALGASSSSAAAAASLLQSKQTRLVLCFLGLQVSYVTWGFFQEQVMTQEYALGRFKSSTFCVFENRVFALILALVIVNYNRYVTNKKQGSASMVAYIPSSLSNSLSSWSQYEALKYVSFPAQVLSKSCKIIPVMLVGIILNQKAYPLLEYAEAVAISSGAAIFTLYGNDAQDNSRENSYWGIMLLLFYLFCDAFTSQWQSRVFKRSGVDQYQMMLGVNFWSIVFTGITLIQSGEGASSIAFIMADSRAMMHMMLLAATSAIGQLFIFYTIKEFGPVMLTVMMTMRQIISLVFSCVYFGHPLNWSAWLSAMVVFGVVINRIYRKGSD